MANPIGKSKAHIKWHYLPWLAATAAAARAPISGKRQGKSYAYAVPSSPSTTLCFLHCFLALLQLRQCGFNLQFAAAVIWQIVCRKNKRRRRSSLAPTIQQLRRWRRRRRQRRLRRGTDFGRGQFILPGTLLLHPALMGLLCLAALLIQAPAATPAGCCITLSFPPSTVSLFAVQRLSEVQIVCQVFSQQLRVFFLSYLICDWAERANKLVAALSIECGKPPPAPFSLSTSLFESLTYYLLLLAHSTLKLMRKSPAKSGSQ